MGNDWLYLTLNVETALSRWRFKCSSVTNMPEHTQTTQDETHKMWTRTRSNIWMRTVKPSSYQWWHLWHTFPTPRTKSTTMIKSMGSQCVTNNQLRTVACGVDMLCQANWTPRRSQLRCLNLGIGYSRLMIAWTTCMVLASQLGDLDLRGLASRDRWLMRGCG